MPCEVCDQITLRYLQSNTMDKTLSIALALILEEIQIISDEIEQEYAKISYN